VLHVAALSPFPARQYVARLWCNGEPAGFASVRAPDGEPRYHSVDVTRLLRPGRNALTALCYTTDDQRFLVQLEIIMADRRRRTIDSGTDWKARRQGGMLADHGNIGGGYYTAPQEYWDLRFEPADWTRPGFQDAAWPAAVAKDPIRGLVPALTETIGVVEVKPGSVTKIGAGHWRIDLGKEIVGGLAIDAYGGSGQSIDVRLGEELNTDGSVRYQLRAGNTYREVWTLREGAQHVEHWGYRGFRYAELLFDPAIRINTVTGRARRLAWRDGDSTFASSDAGLDRVYSLCRYSVEASRGDLYQDTPTRERGPYEGDAFISQRSEYALQRSYALARYSDHYLSRMPTWPTEYRLMSVLAAWYDYVYTGDPDQLASDYDVFVAKNLTSYLRPDDLVHKAPGSSGRTLDDLVDWPVDSRDGYVFSDVNTVVNAFQHAAFDALASVAGVLGKAGDAAKWRELADGMAIAIHSNLLGTGQFVDGIGTSHSATHATAFPVALGLGEADMLAAFGKTLAAHGMAVSVYGAQFLLDALFTCGRADAAISLMTAAGTNSWQHMLDDLGATIVTEAWDPSLKPNMTFSHAWASAPANVISRQVLGVQVTAPGAAAVDVRPRLGPLTRVSRKVPTIRGSIGVALDKTSGYRLDVDVPPNMAARLIVEVGTDDPAAYRISARSAPRATGSDVAGRLLLFGPVGSGRTTVIRDADQSMPRSTTPARTAAVPVRGRR
jgi:alpha-L-rhamnosidase